MPKNGRGKLKPVSKIALKKWNTKCLFGYRDWQNKKAAFSDFPLLEDMFH